MRRTLALLTALSILALFATPMAAAAEAAPADIACNPTGFIGLVVCAVVGIACTLLVFLLGPNACNG